MYRAFGYGHATLSSALRRVRDAHGQGTVEYVALILLVALVMAGVVAGVVAAMDGFKTDEGQALGDVILSKIKQAVRKVQF
jgi:Flp pilus assembly pilin Flp